MSLQESLERKISEDLLAEAQRLSRSTPVEWIEENFYIPETKDHPIYQGRIFLQEYQKDTLTEAFRIDPRTGLYVYSTIGWFDIKKSAKSSIAAAGSLYIADNHPWAENYHVANDLKQVDTRVAYYMRRGISLSPYLKQRFRTRGYNILHNSNGSRIESIPIDPEGEAGSNADLIQFSELWGAMDDAKSRMWTEMTLSPTKFGRSFRWIESYAGYQDESEILWDLYDIGVLQGEMLWPDRDYHVNEFFGPPQPLELYVNREARMLTLWNTVPRCPWQTQDYYTQEAAMLHPMEFRRMHRNEWISNTDTFVPIEWWDACEKTNEEWPEIPPDWPMILVADASTRKDTFGVLKGCRHPDREKYPEVVLVQYANNWLPGTGARGLDYIGTEENPGPEREMRRLIKEYNIIQLAYDEYQLHDMMNRFSKEGLVWTYRFPQGTGKHSRQISDAALYDKIRDRKIWHRGEPVLRQHIQNADAKIDDQERRMRIIKRTEKLKVDLCVCLSMLAYQLFRLNL